MSARIKRIFHLTAIVVYAASVLGCGGNDAPEAFSAELSFENASMSLGLGESQSIGLMFREKPSDSFEPYDFSANPMLAKIICEPKGIVEVTKGVATAIMPGTATLTATIKTGAGATMQISVDTPDCKLAFQSLKDTLMEGETIPCDLLVSVGGGEYLPYDFANDSLDVQVSAKTEKVAFVDAGGMLCALSNGSTTLTASLFGGTVSASKRITVLRDTTELRFMQFNILQGTNEKEGYSWATNRRIPCVNMLREIDPDIIALEEARKQQCADLANDLPQYAQVKFPKDSIESNGGQRNAILYKSSMFEMLGWDKYWFTVDGTKNGDRWGDNELTTPKMTIYAKLRHKESNRILWVFGAHYFAKVQNEATRGKCVEMTRDRILQYTDPEDPVIFAGDLNIIPTNPYLKQYFEDTGFLYNAAKTAESSDGTGQRTSNDFSKDGGYVIDYIWYRNLACRTYRVIVTDDPSHNYGIDYISDHYPLYSDMRLFNKPLDWVED